MTNRPMTPYDQIAQTLFPDDIVAAMWAATQRHYGDDESRHMVTGVFAEHLKDRLSALQRALAAAEDIFSVGSIDSALDIFGPEGIGGHLRDLLAQDLEGRLEP